MRAHGRDPQPLAGNLLAGNLLAGNLKDVRRAAGLEPDAARLEPYATLLGRHTRTPDRKALSERFRLAARRAT